MPSCDRILCWRLIDAAAQGIDRNAVADSLFQFQDLGHDEGFAIRKGAMMRVSHG